MAVIILPKTSSTKEVTDFILSVRERKITYVVYIYGRHYYYINGFYHDRSNNAAIYMAEDWFNSLNEKDQVEALFRIDE